MKLMKCEDCGLEVISSAPWHDCLTDEEKRRYNAVYIGAMAKGMGTEDCHRVAMLELAGLKKLREGIARKTMTAEEHNAFPKGRW